MKAPALVFVYNADSGLFNSLTDIAHKIFSPQTYACRLCAITHSHLAMRGEWRAFIEGLRAECEFLHRDELASRYGVEDIALPAVFRRCDQGLRPCLDAERIGRCQDMAELKRLIRDHCMGGSKPCA
jgi:hypothetical protein